jgi:hypothetical protein
MDLRGAVSGAQKTGRPGENAPDSGILLAAGQGYRSQNCVKAGTRSSQKVFARP